MKIVESHCWAPWSQILVPKPIVSSLHRRVYAIDFLIQTVYGISFATVSDYSIQK